MKRDELPRIYTDQLFAMKTGEEIEYPGFGTLECVSESRREFLFKTSWEGWDNIPFTFDREKEMWVAAQYFTGVRRWRCYDMLPEHAATYAYALTVSALWGVRRYKSPGVLIRRHLERPILF